MTPTDAKTQVTENGKKKRHRSPNYPTVGLREAIERVKRFVTTDGRAGAIPAIAAKHIGFASAHGQAYSVLSALKKFGLLDDKDGRVAPTQRAMEIVNLPETDERRIKAIREAALSPSIYAELIEQHKSTGLPSDDTLAGELVAYGGFNPNSVKEFLKGFRETLEFAGLTDFSMLESEKRTDDGKKKPKVGDPVQWVSQGADQFRQLRRVVRFSDDGDFAFVEGEKTGIPVEELEIGETPATPPLKPAANATIRRRQEGDLKDMRQDVFSLDNGGEVTISWPVPLTQEMITDIEDWLKIVTRKIARSGNAVASADTDKPQE
jgi:hypothetical protein